MTSTGRGTTPPPASRVWGAAAAGQQPARESPETAGLDNQGILALQQQRMAEQERRVETIGASVMRQKEIAVTIHDELTEQTQLLDEIDAHVDKTTGRVEAGTMRTRRVTEKGRQSGMIWTILLLFIILIVVAALAIWL